jgi:thioredoxin reductase
LGLRLIINDDIIKISSDKNGNIDSIIGRSGSYIDVIFYDLGYEVENQIAKQLGCGPDEEGFIKVKK